MTRRIDHQSTAVGLMLRRAENGDRTLGGAIWRAFLTACGLLGFVLIVTAMWGM